MQNQSKWLYILTDDTHGLTRLRDNLNLDGWHCTAPPNVVNSVKAVIPQVEPLPISDWFRKREDEPDSVGILVSYASNDADALLLAQIQAAQGYALKKPGFHGWLISHRSHLDYVSEQNVSHPEQFDAIQQLLTRILHFGCQVNLRRDEQSTLGCQFPVFGLPTSLVDALEVLNGQEKLARIDSLDLQNILRGTNLMIQMARTPELHSTQAALYQNGFPAQVICTDLGIKQAIEYALLHNSMYANGGTLITSESIGTATLQGILKLGVKILISPEWPEDTLTEAIGKLIPIQFHVDRYTPSPYRLTATDRQNVLYEVDNSEERLIQWHTTIKPTEPERLDLEIAVLCAEQLSPGAAVFVHQQKTISSASGTPVTMEAVDQALAKGSGELGDSVCALSGNVLHEYVFDALVQSRIRGAILLHSAEIPQAIVDKLDNADFFLGSVMSTPPAKKVAVPTGSISL